MQLCRAINCAPTTRCSPDGFLALIHDQPFQSVQQHALVERRFGDVGVGAGIEAAPFVFVGGEGGHQDHRQLFVARFCANARGEGEAVHVGHHDVRHHCGEGAAAEDVEGIHAVHRRDHLVAAVFENAFLHGADQRRIFHQQYGGFCSLVQDFVLLAVQRSARFVCRAQQVGGIQHRADFAAAQHGQGGNVAHAPQRRAERFGHHFLFGQQIVRQQAQPLVAHLDHDARQDVGCCPFPGRQFQQVGEAGGDHWLAVQHDGQMAFEGEDILFAHAPRGMDEFDRQSVQSAARARQQDVRGGETQRQAQLHRQSLRRSRIPDGCFPSCARH